SLSVDRPHLFRSIIAPHLSILFPYTTLFRSLEGVQRLRVERADLVVAVRPRRDAAALVARGELRVRHHGRHELVRQGHAIVVHRDRKSTRLNSSHVKISYAVFCLKKKKQIKY